MRQAETDARALLGLVGPALFVATATGQNAANLPPILEAGRPGDRVLWLESAQARVSGWVEGAREVLERRQFGTLGVLEIPEDPAGVATALCARLASDDASGYSPVIVQNGGTKLQTLGLGLACAGRPHPVIYGQSAPVELWVLPDGAAGACHALPYRRSDVALGEYLRCSGHEIVNPCRARKLWPGPVPAEQGYGVDPEATAEEHRRSSARSLEAQARERGYPTYREVLSVRPEDLDGWCRQAARTGKSLARRADLAAPGIAERCGPQAEALFNRMRVIAQGVDQSRSAVPATPDKLGDLFERAVARRAHAWLETHGDRHGVVEAWCGIKVRRTGEVMEAAEWDPVLMLRNSNLVSIECKSWEYKRKDLDARLLNLQTAGTRPAKMVLCVPIYTAFSQEPWFKETLEKSDQFRKRKQAWLAFGLPGQSQSFTLTVDEVPREETLLSFEEGLGSVMAAYAPR